ncbi:tetratricopeptide repeat protein [Sphingomonas sp. UNC305MFCol5.2]|uniref:tetratricopeptide repeat protein n=1 Tax=Sphingomonas sp. UNC305MFCol5.2 TaxID=1449076 RepID=UPI0003FE66E9|nr:tetratricopeptide repeat protein [Sphingomonas sp. UNC305MFCol5.2]
MIRMHWLAALALIAASPALARPAQDTPEQAARNAKLGEALVAIDSKKPAEAIAILQPLLADYEKIYAGEKRRIYCNQTPKQTMIHLLEATLTKQDAIAIEPGWCTALWAQGFALIDLKQVDAAVPFLERAVSLAPAHPHYLSELGYAYQAQRKWQLSYDTFQRAAAGAAMEEDDQRKKSLRRAWFGMSYARIEQGRLDEAEKLLGQCLELTPDDQRVKDELQYVRDQRKKTS